MGHDSGELDGDKLSDGSQGLRAIMGAVTMSTRGIIVAAPMAAYLVRNNCSRFCSLMNLKTCLSKVFGIQTMQGATSQFLKKMAKRNHSCLQEHTSIATERWNWTMCVCTISFPCTQLVKNKAKRKKKKI